MTFETFVQSDEKTWHDQKIDKDKYKYKDNDKDILRKPPKSNSRDLWHLRHWLQFWQLRTWIINCDTGQHLQFLRCLYQVFAAFYLGWELDAGCADCCLIRWQQLILWWLPNHTPRLIHLNQLWPFLILGLGLDQPYHLSLLSVGKIHFGNINLNWTTLTRYRQILLRQLFYNNLKSITNSLSCLNGWIHQYSGSAVSLIFCWHGQRLCNRVIILMDLYAEQYPQKNTHQDITDEKQFCGEDYSTNVLDEKGVRGSSYLNTE